MLATTNATAPARTTADVATRRAVFSSATDQWPTPTDFFAALDAEFGFVLDVCADADNRKADTYYGLDHADTARRDGLAGDWAPDARALAGAVWMNPPYGRGIGDWMAKAAAAAHAGATVVTLVPVRADAAWWHAQVLAAGAEVRYVRGRLTFGTATTSAPFASAVVIYRPTDVPGTPGPVGTIDRTGTAQLTATPPAPRTDETFETGPVATVTGEPDDEGDEGHDIDAVELVDMNDTDAMLELLFGIPSQRRPRPRRRAHRRAPNGSGHTRGPNNTRPRTAPRRRINGKQGLLQPPGGGIVQFER